MGLTAQEAFEQAYALSRKYTSATAEEFGAVKGANCQIKSIVKANNRNTVTFLWKNSQGVEQESQMIVEDGTPIYEWHSGDTYEYGDLCIYQSDFYRCIITNSDVTFDPKKWNEIGSPNSNFDIVQNSSLLPPIYTAADIVMYWSIEDECFFLWNGSIWVKQNQYFIPVNQLPVASKSTLNKLYAVPVMDSGVISSYESYITIESNNIYSWYMVGGSDIEETSVQDIEEIIHSIYAEDDTGQIDDDGTVIEEVTDQEIQDLINGIWND